MASVASIVIEVQDAQANAAMQRPNAQASQLGQTFQPVQRISEQTFNNIEGGALKARESAALLGEEFGVKVPRALRGVIAESSLLGPAFTAAFSGLAVFGFINIVKQAIDQLTGFSEGLKAVEKQNAELMQSIGAANKTLIGPQSLKQVTDEAVKTQKAIDDLNARLGINGVFYEVIARGVAKYSQKQRVLIEALDEQKTHLKDLIGEEAKLRDEQSRTEPIEVLKLQNAARLEGLEGIKKINEQERGETSVIRAEMNARITTHRVGNAEINEIHRKGVAARERLERDATIQGTQAYLQAKILAAKGEEQIHQELNLRLFQIEQEELQKGMRLDQLRQAAQMDAATKLKELRRQSSEETLKIEQEAAVAILPAWQRSYAQISIDTQNRLREIQRALNETRITGEEASRQIAATWQLNFAKMRDQLAGDLENLFDNITSGNIGKFFLAQFKHLVFQMVASWILGMQQMKGASQQTMNGGGGILGAIFGSLGLGGIFGGGGGGSQGGISSLPGVITNFGGGNGDFGGEVTGGGSGGGGLLASLELSAGGGASATGTTLPAGAGAGSLGGPLAGLMGKVFSHGIGPVSGSALAAIGIGLFADSFRKGGVLRGLEGAAGGALTGFTIGGPIGAIIGGIVGFIAGIWGHSTRKARLAIEADIKRKAATIEDAYNLFQTDWVGSRDALEQLRQAGVDALKQAGVKDINRSRKGHVDQWIDKAEKEIDLTQAERNRRAALTFGPAEFRVGGFVGAGAGGAIPSWFADSAMHFAGGGAVPAILHSGEFVMRQEAVAQYGVATMNRMNAGGGAGAGGPTIIMNVQTTSPADFSKYLRDGGLAQIKREWRRADDRGW